MIRSLFIAGVFLLAYHAAALAQNDRVVVVDETHKRDHFSIRVGAWFPKDTEKEFTFDDASFSKADSRIEQSQALGLDFHYRSEVGHPLYFDFAAGAWYSSYDFSPSTLAENPAKLQDAASWAVIVPLTLGASFTVLPDNPIQPYAMAGIGAYVGFSERSLGFEFGRTDGMVSKKENKTLVRVGWYFGAGVDFYISRSFAFSLAAKYTSLKYQEKLYTQQQDFTGLQVSLGFTTGLR